MSASESEEDLAEGEYPTPYSKQLRQLCEEGASERKPRVQDRRIRCEKNHVLKRLILKKPSHAGSHGDFCYQCNFLHIPDQPGPDKALRMRIKAQRRLDILAWRLKQQKAAAKTLSASQSSLTPVSSSGSSRASRGKSIASAASSKGKKTLRSLPDTPPSVLSKPLMVSTSAVIPASTATTFVPSTSAGLTPAEFDALIDGLTKDMPEIPSMANHSTPSTPSPLERKRAQPYGSASSSKMQKVARDQDIAASRDASDIFDFTGRNSTVYNPQPWSSTTALMQLNRGQDITASRDASDMATKFFDLTGRNPPSWTSPRPPMALSTTVPSPSAIGFDFAPLNTTLTSTHLPAPSNTGFGFHASSNTTTGFGSLAPSNTGFGSLAPLHTIVTSTHLPAPSKTLPVSPVTGSDALGTRSKLPGVKRAPRSDEEVICITSDSPVSVKTERRSQSIQHSRRSRPVAKRKAASPLPPSDPVESSSDGEPEGVISMTSEARRDLMVVVYTKSYMAPFRFGLQILSSVVCLSNYPIIQQFCDVENADHVRVWVEEECIWKTVLFDAYFTVGTRQFALVVRLADVKSLYNFKVRAPPEGAETVCPMGCSTRTRLQIFYFIRAVGEKENKGVWLCVCGICKHLWIPPQGDDYVGTFPDWVELKNAWADGELDLTLSENLERNPKRPRRDSEEAEDNEAS
ncbi:hypothetical protein EW026_g8067 [Hermanssonia centrifuga]|uniref:Uncharacterized protein n=1 Tax=Hermanssonia centrifuga TaxID=98765 RepID=A0A4S4K5M1_9APHY|nr:hypothetical protein EW026_g8067 [Hermanssonia centrifuga]